MAITYTYEDFYRDFPEFAEISQEIVDINITRSMLVIKETFWKHFASEAVGLLTAHEIYLKQLDALELQRILSTLRNTSTIKTGAQLDKKLGYGNGYLDSSVYGVRLQYLAKQLPRSGFVW